MLVDDGLGLEIGRFDPGKVSSQDEQILLPTTTLPGDYIISLTVVSELEDIRIDVIDRAMYSSTYRCIAGLIVCEIFHEINIVTQIVVIEVPH